MTDEQKAAAKAAAESEEPVATLGLRGWLMMALIALDERDAEIARLTHAEVD